MAITISALMTNGGAPYSSYTPLISIWRVSNGTLVVNGAGMTQIGTTAFYKYDFTTYDWGVPYVYLITGSTAVTPNERYQSGNVMQEIPDRVVRTVVADAGNTLSQFKTDCDDTPTDYWKDSLCLFLSGGNRGQVKKVTAYNGSTFTLTFTNGFTGAPNAGDSFALINF